MEAGLAQFLYYKPERVLLHRYDCGIWVLSVSAATDSWSMEWPCVLDGNEFLAVAGVPTLENLESGVGSIAERLVAALRVHGPNWMHNWVGGSFSIGWMRRKSKRAAATVGAFSDFSGYCSCFYLNNDDYFAVGNRASFVGAFRPRFPEKNEIDPGVLSWLVGTTMIMGPHTPFRGVSRLRSGNLISVSIDEGGVVEDPKLAPAAPGHFDSVPVATVEDLDFADICSRIGRRIRWSANQGIRFRAHLTGGRDTRVVAGLLANQGVIDAVDRFTTSGTEQNGDVLVARKVAEALSIESKHFVASGAKGEEPMTSSEVADVVLRSPFLYECQLTPFDGRRFPLATMGGRVTIMGGGGEIYRQEWGSGDTLTEPDRAHRALSLYSKYDPLGLLSDDSKQAHIEQITEELDFLEGTGVANVPCAFYMDQRLSNWGSGHFTNALAAQMPMLLDRELARAVLSVTSVSEHVHFQLLRHCDKSLLAVPFLNNRWAEDTEREALRLGLATDPIVVPLERNFPWQFDCYRRFRDAAIDFCIECGTLMREHVPVEKLEALRKTPIEPFGSAQIKMLFGLCGAVLLAEGGWSRRRDRYQGDDPEYKGNRVATIHRVVVEEQKGSGTVADELKRRFTAADALP